MSYTPAYRRILHRMGYYSYQQGLIHRHLNQEDGWNSHLRNCREFILSAVEACKPEVVTVLGSGWLLDVPLKEMAEQVSTVNLVDILHPPEVREQVSRLENVRLSEADITGGLIEDVWKKTGHGFCKKRGSVNDLEIPGFQFPFEPGLIVSLNIMTQLESLPLEYIRKKWKPGEEDLAGFRKEIQQRHISLLMKHTSVLITDTAEIIAESPGRIREVPSVLTDLPDAGTREEWTWDFDLHRSDYYNRRSVFRVVAMLLGEQVQIRQESAAGSSH